MTRDDPHWMAHALGLAQRGIGSTGTNPSVGCVIVRDGIALGRGRTGTGGRPHAERMALDDAAARYGTGRIQGATAYVTLEPCAHTGKTPPCTDALITSGISRVVAPISDPDKRVAGRGFASLEEAGIAVDVGQSATQARHVLRGYLSRTEKKRPFLTLKLASTLDGHIATRSGESRWITGNEARQRVHLMRARSDAILVGVGSVLADNPALDVRLPGLAASRPVRVVADTRLQTPLTSRLAQSAADQPLVLLTSTDAEQPRVEAFQSLGAQILSLPMHKSGVSMSDALSALGDIGIGTLLCEGGGRLAASVIREGLVDELVWFSAGAAMGDGGAAAISDFGIQTLGDVPRFDRMSLECVGEDIMSVWRPRRDAADGALPV